MANIKSAAKRHKISERNRQKNRFYDSTAKTFKKKFLSAAEAYQNNPNSQSIENLENLRNLAYSKIDKAVKKGVYQTNKAKRLKSKIAKVLSACISLDDSRTVSSLAGDDVSTYPRKEEKEEFIEEKNRDRSEDDSPAQEEEEKRDETEDNSPTQENS